MSKFMNLFGSKNSSNEEDFFEPMDSYRDQEKCSKCERLISLANEWEEWGKKQEELRKHYERKLLEQKEIYNCLYDEFQCLKSEHEQLKASRLKVAIQPKQRQISDYDIRMIKYYRNLGYSYSLIQKEIGWSKCTISRVLNGFYDTP